MTPSEYRAAGEIFNRVRELPEGEVEPALSTACADQPALRAQVERLLQADRAAGDGAFLGRKALEDAAAFMPPDQPPQLPTEGSEIGNYRLGARIGAGGMGVVYSGLDLRLHRRVAIKILPHPSAGEGVERVKRFERESRAASALNHPNIVSIFDAGFDRGYYYIAMELVEGQTLRQAIAEGLGVQRGALFLLELLAQTASALGAAHQAGIVHRDIKPENIMVRPDGFVKVLDFGLAKLGEPVVGAGSTSTLLSRPGSLAGTIQYLSPEQVAGKPVDARSDLFSLGVVAYELATGVRPFDGPTDGAVFDAILNRAPAPPATLVPGLGNELSGLILRALDKNPELRFQTAGDLRSLCKRLIRDYSASHVSASPAAPSQPAAPRAARLWPFAALAAVGLASAAAVWMAISQPSPAPLPYSFERQTDDPGEELFPSLAPDGKQFVYASARDGNWDIFLKRTGGVAAINLTKDFAGTDTTPAFSPDSTRIAFRSERDGGGLFVMEATGENPRRITTAGYHPAWSPDGTQLAYCDTGFTNPSRRSRAPLSRIFIASLAGGTPRELKGTADAIQPAWSPHGHRIAYWGVVGNTGRRDVFTIAADGSGAPVPVTSDGAIDWNPAWSPSGRELYFLSSRGGTMNAWRVAIDEKSGRVDGAPEPVTTPALYAKHLGLAANGSHLVFVRSDETTTLFTAGLQTAGLRLENPPVPAGHEGRTVSAFSLSPDDTRIAYDTVGDPQEDIWLMNADGTGRRRLTDDAFMDRDPCWSPDGKEIAFFSDRESKTLNVWAIRTDGGGLRRVTDFPDTVLAHTIAWGHDGKRILLVSEPRGPSWVRSDTVSTEAVPLSDNPAIMTGFVPPWNPPLRPSESDKWLTVGRVNGVRTLWTYAMSSGRAESAGVEGDNPYWLPGHRQFVFTRGDAVRIFDLATREDRVLFDTSPARPWRLRATRDGRRIYFSKMAREADIWIGRMSRSRDNEINSVPPNPLNPSH